MKKFLFITAIILGSVLMTASAGPAKHKLTSEQQVLKKEMLEKYDTNKNGRLDRKERASMSKEDRERLQKAGLDPRRKKASKATN